MSGFTANLSGFAQLQARLNQLSKEEATKAGQIANRAGAAVLRKKAMEGAPVSNVAEGTQITRHNKSGTTRVEKHRKIINWIKVKKTKSDSPTKVQNTVSVGAYQASFVEHGSIHNAPNPFFRRAFEAHNQEIIDAMAKVLNRQLVKRGV
jgi:HK97 gp10 family phage protein